MYTKKTILISMIIIFSTILPVQGSHIVSQDYDQNRYENDEQFDRAILNLMKQGHIPSLSACIVKNKEIIWIKGYGHYNLSSELTPQNDTIYMVASVSKTITATAMMQLYEKGLFSLDDDINKYLPFTLRNPKYPNVPITFRMLLSHRSSFINNILSSEDYSKHFFYKHFLYLGHLKDIFSSFYPDEFSSWLQKVMTPNGSLYDPEYWGDYPPGDQSSYSGINFILLGYLIEILSNQSYESYCKEHLFIPLEMNNTGFRLNELDIDKMAVPYLWFGLTYLPISHYEYRCYNPAAGLRTTVTDLSHFLIAYMNGGVYQTVRILNESTIQEMHRIQYAGVGYGLGFEIGRIGFDTIIGHWGRNVGYISHMFLCSSKNLGLIYFYNEYSPNSVLFFGDYLGFTPNEAVVRYELPNLLWQKANEL